MTYVQALSVLGLVANLIGVILLFRYGTGAVGCQIGG